RKSTSPPSRRSFARRSPSTVRANRNARRKRSLSGCCACVNLSSPCSEGTAHQPLYQAILVAHGNRRRPFRWPDSADKRTGRATPNAAVTAFDVDIGGPPSLSRSTSQEREPQIHGEDTPHDPDQRRTSHADRRRRLSVGLLGRGVCRPLSDVQE